MLAAIVILTFLSTFTQAKVILPKAKQERLFSNLNYEMFVLCNITTDYLVLFLKKVLSLSHSKENRHLFSLLITIIYNITLLSIITL